MVFNIDAMFFVALTLIALVLLDLIGVIYLYLAAKNAPQGYEDETGFHYGREPEPKAQSTAA